ncbi:MAG: hypothetical protein KDC75_02625, partial [Phaeodactylibacter sp.]|nr:hypothetical protein [Phaeodactylibacter sp.]
PAITESDPSSTSRCRPLVAVALEAFVSDIFTFAHSPFKSGRAFLQHAAQHFFYNAAEMVWK